MAGLKTWKRRSDSGDNAWIVFAGGAVLHRFRRPNGIVLGFEYRLSIEFGEMPERQRILAVGLRLPQAFANLRLRMAESAGARFAGVV